MNKAERIRAALAGEAVDRVPASFWFHFPADARVGTAMAEAHLRYYEKCDPDWLKIMNDNGYALPVGAGRGETILPLEELARPRGAEDEGFAGVLEGVAGITERLGPEVPSVVTVFCPFATFNYATGKQAEELIRTEPAASEAALGAISESLIAFGKACLERGAWGVYFAAQGGETGRLTPEEHARFVERFDRAVLDGLAAAPFNFLHVCGDGLRLDPYWTYPVACINWAAGAESGNPSISAARQETQLPIAAGLHNRGPLTKGPEADLRLEIEAALSEGGRSRFLLAAGCTLPDDVDWRWPKLGIELCKSLQE